MTSWWGVKTGVCGAELLAEVDELVVEGGEYGLVLLEAQFERGEAAREERVGVGEGVAGEGAHEDVVGEAQVAVSGVRDRLVDGGEREVRISRSASRAVNIKIGV